MKISNMLIMSLLAIMIVLVGCTSNKSNDSSSATDKSSAIELFESDFYNSVKEISLYPNDNKVVIKDKEKIKDICELFCSLDPTETKDQNLEGGIIIDFLTDNKTISVTVFEEQIITDTKAYSVNKNIITSIEKYYNS